jgi:hypothetical protein
MTFSTKILVVVTAVAAGAVVAVVLAFEGADATPGARFSVLNKPAASIPPGSFTADLRNAGADRDQDARLALRRSGLEFYVVSTAQDRLCLAVRSRAATVSTCAARSTLDPTSLIWIGHAKPNGVFDHLQPTDRLCVALASTFHVVVSQSGSSLSVAPQCSFLELRPYALIL